MIKNNAAKLASGVALFLKRRSYYAAKGKHFTPISGRKTSHDQNFGKGIHTDVEDQLPLYITSSEPLWKCRTLHKFTDENYGVKSGQG